MKRLAKLILLALAGLFIINFFTNKKIPVIPTKSALEMAVEQSMLETTGSYGIYIKNRIHVKVFSNTLNYFNA